MKRALQLALSVAACSAVVGWSLTAGAADLRGEKVAGAHTHRASTLIGMTVRNEQGEKIGTVEDLVTNMQNGQITYAALGFGGFLGFGEKLFAIPLSQMKMEHQTNDTYFVLNVAKEKLKAAPGFDKNHWPDLANANWSNDIDKYYRHEEVTPNAAQTSPNMQTYRVSKLRGMSVHNRQGESVGSIDDLVIDMTRVRINYAALGFGGVLGLGEKLFAVPFSQLTFNNTANETYFVLNVTKEQLKAAPGFDKEHWPDLGDPNWSRDIDRHYPQATTTTTSEKSTDEK